MDPFWNGPRWIEESVTSPANRPSKKIPKPNPVPSCRSALPAWRTGPEAGLVLGRQRGALGPRLPRHQPVAAAVADLEPGRVVRLDQGGQPHPTAGELEGADVGGRRPGVTLATGVRPDRPRRTTPSSRAVPVLPDPGAHLSGPSTYPPHLQRRRPGPGGTPQRTLRPPSTDPGRSSAPPAPWTASLTRRTGVRGLRHPPPAVWSSAHGARSGDRSTRTPDRRCDATGATATVQAVPTPPRHPGPHGGDELNSRVLTLVAELPEIYQPIYGQPQVQGSRTADSQRISLVSGIVDGLATLLGRPLAILDLGSAQGYVDFRLAEAGHRVVGIELLDKNIAVARAIHEQHPDLDVAFVEGNIVDCASLVDPTQFDLVLGLSVLHHVIDRDGHDRAVDLVRTLADAIPHGVFEMALASEPVFWAPSLPADPRVTLAPYAFIREIGRSGTHLSDVQRPLLFASATHVLTAAGLRAIDTWGDQAHADAAHHGLRRHFQVGGDLVKIAARFTDDAEDGVLEVYRQELRNEAHVLELLAASACEAPRLVEFVDGADESIIVRTSYPGVLLSDVAPSLSDGQRALVTGQVLTSLAELEAQGLYHSDLRLWNVIWDPGTARAHLIDHGSVGPVPTDVVWPHDGYFSFLVWLVSLWGPFDDQTGIRVPRTSRLDQADHPAAVVALIGRLMAHHDDGHVFRDLAAAWADGTEGAATSWPAPPVVWHWLAELEQERTAAVEALGDHERYVDRRAQQLGRRAGHPDRPPRGVAERARGAGRPGARARGGAGCARRRARGAPSGGGANPGTN